ncbi:MAG: hypothetical protein ABI967_03375 [bacterium]
MLFSVDSELRQTSNAPAAVSKVQIEALLNCYHPSRVPGWGPRSRATAQAVHGFKPWFAQGLRRCSIGRRRRVGLRVKAFRSPGRHIEAAPPSSVFDHFAGHHQMLRVPPVHVRGATHLHPCLGAPAGRLAPANLKRAHLAGRERERVAGLEVRAVAIEYAGLDLQRIAADVKVGDAERLPNGDADRAERAGDTTVANGIGRVIQSQHVETALTSRVFDHLAGDHQVPQVRPVRMHSGAYFDAALRASANLAAAQVQKAHLAGRERDAVTRLEVRAVAIEYAGLDLQRIAADVKEADAERLPKGDGDGRHDIDGGVRVPVAIVALRAGDRRGQDCG